MTLTEAIAQADGLKPNAYTDAQKTAWINEVEGHVQTEILNLPYSGVHNGAVFTTNTIALVGRILELKAGDTVEITECAVVPGNNIEAVITSVSYSSSTGLTTLTFPAATFTAGTETDKIVITRLWPVIRVESIVYDAVTDASTELMVPAPYDRLYQLYIFAQIDMYMQDMDLYAVSAKAFNDAFEDYQKFYRRTHEPAQTTRIHNLWG